MNEAGERGQAFFFALDYEGSEGVFILNPLSSLEDLGGLAFAVGEYQSPMPSKPRSIPSILAVRDEGLSRYAERFDVIYKGLHDGDSFLANLTLRTPIDLGESSLEDIYAYTSAKYKLLLPNKCVCFSPETFVQIRDNKISTYPMKGTIDATLPQAEDLLLNDYKEHCEHCTIVDLMRNDLSRISERVRVNRFKYLDRLETSRGAILQMSSEVVGHLAEGWQGRIGHIIDSLLPAGSISGAPKARTCELIAEAEQMPRTYYTGVCGYFDGQALDSGVLIRFIEQEEAQYYYRSGGGITINSQMAEEYQECLAKIYLPLVLS